MQNQSHIKNEVKIEKLRKYLKFVDVSVNTETSSFNFKFLQKYFFES